MTWFSRWFSSPTQKRSLDGDIEKPQEKKARVLFENPSSEENNFRFEPFKTIGTGNKELRPLVTSSLVPRPFALVATINKQSELSLVPTSFCSLVSEDPAYVCIGLSKDALPEDLPVMPADNLRETKDLTVSIVSEWIAEAANVSAGAYELPAGTAEADLKTGLTTSDSKMVKAPRISEAAVVLECKLRHKFSIKDSEGEVASTVVIAEVLCAAVKQGVLAESATDEAVVDVKKLRPVAKLGSGLCGRVLDAYRLPEALPSPLKPSGQEEIAEAVATAVAEVLDAEPPGAAVKAVTVTIGEDAVEEKGEGDEAIPVTVVQE